MCKNNYKDILKAKEGDKEKLNELIQTNMGLVYSISKRFKDRGYELEDLNQIGTIGLIKAIKNFDVSYNVQLSTYSVPYIVGEIKRFIRDDGIVKVSRNLKELSNKINIIKKEYEDKYNEEISVGKIAKALNVSKEEVATSIAATSNGMIVSMYETIKSDDKMCIADTLRCEKNESAEIINKVTIEKLIKELPKRDKDVIILRYFKGQTQTEVAKKMGISQVQISRIEKKVLLEMRKKIIC